MALFDAVDIIRTKRDGGVLTPDQIDWTIDAYTKGVVKDEQMAALAMAIFLRGMDRAEIARWTDAMIRSGARMDFSSIGKPTADKHSTGGVGDKITLPLAPLVACFGVAVPQLSGRGLGHTGGTLDKLEVHHRAGELTSGVDILHEGTRADLHVQDQGTRALGDLLAHDRGRNQRDRLHGRGDVAQRVELLVRGSQA